MLKTIRLSASQRIQLANIVGNLGIVFFASMIVPSLLGVDEPDLAMVLSGGFLSGWCFGLSLAIIPKNDN